MNYYNRILESNSCGKYVILGDTEKINNRKYVLIKFIKTNTIKEVRLDTALSGAVLDELYDIDFDKTYHSNLYGPFKILKYMGRNSDGRKLVLIKFLCTGNTKIITYKAAKYGYAVDSNAIVKHPLNTSILTSSERESLIKRSLKQTWRQMICRCTDSNSAGYDNYGAIGVDVDNSWLNFDNFYSDVKLLPQYEKYEIRPFEYQLDKDYLQLSIPKSDRIYSKSTCMFLLNYDNNNLMSIEYRRDHLNELSSQYYGVRKIKYNKYRASIIIDGKNISIGTFNSEIAAANAFNYWFETAHHYELIPLYNDVPYMSPTEFIKYNVAYKEIIRLVSDIKNTHI